MGSIFAAILLATGPAQAGRTATVFGMGNSSCATAFRDENAIETRTWILGYWSGWNMATVEQVGKGIDTEGLVAEVRLACSRRPSQPLVYAILEARQQVRRP